MATKASNFPWTEEREVAFLETVLTMSAHLCNNGNSTARWTQVMESMRRQPQFGTSLMASFFDGSAEKSQVSKQLRKFKEKFSAIMESGKAFLASGNTSKNDGDLDRKHELIQVMLLKMEEKESEDGEKAEAVNNAKAMKQQLDKTSDTIITQKKPWKKPPEGYGKRKHMDGSISDNRTSAKKVGTFEDTLIEIWRGKDSNAKATCHEFDFKQRYVAHLEGKGYGLDALLSCCKSVEKLVNFEEVKVLVETVGLDYFVSLYCTQQSAGQAVASKAFKEQLKDDTGMQPMAITRLYFKMQDWHQEMETTRIECNSSGYLSGTIDTSTPSGDSSSDGISTDGTSCARTLHNDQILDETS